MIASDAHPLVIGRRGLNALRDRPLLRLWVSILATVGVLLALTRGRFTTNDDVLMRSIASGSLGGTPDPHLVYINIVLGGPLSLLYRIAPFVPWYAVLLNSAGALSLGCLAWVLLRNADRSESPFLGLVIGVPLSIGVVLQTFTASAMIATATGMAIHLVSLRDGESRKLDMVALLLVLLGVALRIDAAWFAIALGESAILVTQPRWMSRRHLAFVGAAVVGALALRGIDLSAYRFDEKWHSYKLFNEQLGQLSSTPRLAPSPELTTARIKAGWSASDVVLLDRWLYTDPQVFSAKALATIVDGTRRVTGGRSWVTALRNDIIDPYRGWLVCITAAFLAVGARQWRSIAAVVAMTGLWIAAGTYLSLFRHFPERVAMPGLSTIIVILGAAHFVRGWSRSRVSLLFGLLLIPAIGFIHDGATRAAANNQRLTAQLDAMVRMDNDATYVFVGSSVTLEGQSSLTGDPSGPKRFIVLSWTNFTPPQDRELARLGIIDPIMAAAQRLDVFLVVPAPNAQEYVAYVNDWLTEKSYSGAPIRVVSEHAGLAFLS